MPPGAPPGQSPAGVPATARSPPPLSPPPGREGLEAGQVLGRGGNATVRAARVAGSDRAVALKQPNDPGATTPAVAERFRTEGETLSLLADHDHVVTVHGWGMDPTPWIAMERTTAGDLAARTGTVGAAEGAWVGACVAAALASAHRGGVVHLDLTPANVLFRASPAGKWPVPAVADWGVARPLDTVGCDLAGLTPRYAAPEQFEPDRFGRPGVHTDVYQLAVVVYELLVGDPPFTGTTAALRDAIVDEVPPPASGRNPRLPAAVDEVLDRGLAKHPGDRYDTMAAFQSALGALVTDLTGYDPVGSVAGAHEAALPTTGRDRQSNDVSGSGGGGGAGPAVPFDRGVDPREEGFVRLSEAYFAQRDPADPLAAWRRGVRLVDARAGRAVERTVSADGERVSLTEQLLSGLQDGTDHAVLGPPGAGKSTVCKRVACEWFDRGHGPVFYRETGADERFDRSAALARQLSAVEGHALVVVEDAVRPAADTVFALLARTADVDDVTVLVDARRGEWHVAGEGGAGLGRDPATAARERLTTVTVPRPDATEHDRFVQAVEDAVDRPLDLDREQLQADVRRAATAATDGEADPGRTRPGELFYLLHRLTALARAPATAEPPTTTLTDAVAAASDRLAAAGEDVLDVGVAVNVLNAAGIPVTPGLLTAVVASAPLAVDEGVDLLSGTALFPRAADPDDATRAYPTVHEAWSTAFLAHRLSTAGEAVASDLFRTVLDRILALADDPARRQQVRDAVDGPVPTLDRVAAAPGEWADQTVTALLALGRERPKLAPLFGDGAGDSIPVPAACSSSVTDRLPAALGESFLAGGYYDRAERAFDRLGATDPPERLLGLARVAVERGAFDPAETYGERCLAAVTSDEAPVVAARARLVVGRALGNQGEYEAATEHLRMARERFDAADERARLATTLDHLGDLAREQGDHEAAQASLQRSLEIATALGDRRAAVASRLDLGVTVFERGAFDRARREFERSLEAARELGDRRATATALKWLATVAHNRGEYDRARASYRESLSLYREIGDRNGEASVLGNLGLNAERVGEYDRAVSALEESLALHRSLGDRYGVATRLNNLGLVTVRQGAHDDARGYFREGLEVARDIDAPHREVNSLNGLGHVARLRGAYERAREYHAEALSVTAAVDLRRRQADSHNKLGLVARCMRAPDRAVAHHDRALAVAEDLGHPREAAKALAGLGEVARRRGNLATADERLTDALDRIAATGHGIETARVRLARGRLALARSDPDAARECARAAHEAFTEMATPQWVGRSRRLLGRAALAAGDRDAAAAHLQAALEAADAVDAPQDALAALHHLLEGGVADGPDRERWCRQASELLAAAPSPVAARHRSWVL